MIVLDLSILNQKGTPMFNSDTFANRPAFGIVGRIFISTDTKEFFRDTGTSWELIGGPGSGTITGSGAATQIAFWNSASTITGSNNLWYDSTNSYLGVNTNAPGNPLDVHGSISSVAALNQITATNNTLLSLLNSGTPLWRIGNFYTAGANDFGIFDVVNTLQQLTIVKATGQTFIGAKTTASGRLVVNSATSDAHLQIVGANSPSIRIDNAGSGGTQRFVFGLATATNNFIQGATAGEFCISTQSAGNMLFGMWQTTNASEVMRITTANNLLIGSSVDGGQRLQVAGKVNSTGYFLNGMTSGSGALYWTSDRVTLANYNVGGTLAFEVNGGTNVANIDASGNFLVSATSASFNVAGRGNITIGGTSQSILAMQVNGVAKAFLFYTGTDLLLSNESNGAIKFSTNLSEKMQITSGGNLLVGTTTDAGFKLDVNGTVRFSGALTGTSATFSSGGAFGSFVTVSGSSSDTIGSGSLYQLIGSTSLISSAIQLNASGGIDIWSLVSSSWQKNLSIANTGAATFSSSVTATTFIKSGGTSSQYLMADGSVTTGGGGGSVDELQVSLICQVFG